MHVKFIQSMLLMTVAFWSLSSCNEPAQSQGMQELKAQYDFAVKDTASITKIIIRDKQPSEVILQRGSNGWFIGDHFPVRHDAMEVLLETVSEVMLKNFVAKSAVEAVNQRMAVYGKWVEIYQGEELVKSYIVGTETPDMLGTYFKMMGSDLPFSVYIQGFNGYLTTRFFTEESMWRNRTIYGIAEPRVERLIMDVPGAEGFSWSIDKTPADSLWSLKGSDDQPVPVNPRTLQAVVSSIRTLKYEGAIIPSDNIYAKKDSIFSSTPAFTLSVQTKEGETLSTRAFYKKPEGILIGEDGLPHQWDPDRFYAELPDGRMALIQRYAWRNLMRAPWEFE